MKIAKSLESVRAIASLFYPPNCGVCGGAISNSEHLCSSCHDKAQRILPPFCAKCSEPFAGAIESEFTCANCAHRKLEFDAAISAYRSRSVVRFVILRFKYGRQLYLRHPIAGWIAEAMRDARLQNRMFDLIVPVPLHPARLRERGFNQAHILATMLGHKIGVPIFPVLQRIRYTTTQTVFDRIDRIENLHNAFRLRKKTTVRELRVLLVDDVLTTGSTLSECARVLREAGAR